MAESLRLHQLDGVLRLFYVHTEGLKTMQTGMLGDGELESLEMCLTEDPENVDANARGIRVENLEMCGWRGPEGSSGN